MLALRGRRAFDGDRFVTASTVLVDGSQIVDVAGEPPSDVEVLDLGDVTLLPGLVDTLWPCTSRGRPTPVSHQS